MKNPIPAVSAALLLFFLVPVLPLQAQTVAGNQLEIGPTGSDQVTFSSSWSGQPIPANNAAAIGTNNAVRLSNSMAVGSVNTVSQMDSMAIGAGNMIGASYPWGGRYSVAVGNVNTIFADYSFVTGFGNSLEGSGYETEGSQGSFIAGGWNSSAGKYTFIAGLNCYIEGYDEINGNHHTEAAAVIGRGLLSKWSNSLIAGKYNDSNIDRLSGLLFAIGNGASANSRSNALEVYSSGKVTMPRQGDILMGEFGHPEP